jgi:hypothetical protein
MDQCGWDQEGPGRTFVFFFLSVYSVCIPSLFPFPGPGLCPSPVLISGPTHGKCLRPHLPQLLGYKLRQFFLPSFLSELGFELRALYLQSRCSVLFILKVGDLINYLPMLALNVILLISASQIGL